MWQYVSHELQEVRQSGKFIIRVTMQNEYMTECFFLEYDSMPEPSVVEQHASITINLKNKRLTE
jgi:hypothetical protein